VPVGGAGLPARVAARRARSHLRGVRYPPLVRRYSTDAPATERHIERPTSASTRRRVG
jgi:hypothetical protein